MNSKSDVNISDEEIQQFSFQLSRVSLPEKQMEWFRIAKKLIDHFNATKKLRVFYIVVDIDGSIMYTSMIESLCHDHINEAIELFGDGCAKWVVRKAFYSPLPPTDKESE